MRHVLQTMFGLALCVLALEARAQTIVYVDADATGGNDGTSWEDAFINLQDALGAAGAGDEVWVASGTYYPDRGLGATPGDRSARFRLQSGVALFGGFSGAETQRLQRNPAANPTVLSGDIATAGAPADNSFHVVEASGTDATARLDGFTITAGQADGAAAEDSRGGGLYSLQGSPTLAHLVFTGNVAGVGGGLYNEGGDPVLLDVDFIDNEAAQGGGVLTIPSPGGGNATLTNVRFIGNRATASDGGGLVVGGGTVVAVTNGLFQGNTAAVQGGGLYSGGTARLVNLTLSGNTAGFGGGMALGSGTATLVNSILWGNTADEGEEIYEGGASLTVGFSTVEDLSGAGVSGSYTDGGGNQEADPLFVDAGVGDFQLQLGSPAIDTGDNDAVPAGVLGDLAGNLRIQNGIVDRGAFEFGDEVIPVELTRFEAVPDGADVVLAWQTASETNNAGFEVQHAAVRPAPGTESDWQVLAFVEGHGTTSRAHPYRYRVAGLDPGRHRFRLKQVDFDGAFAFSPEVEVFLGLAERYVLSPAHPNPFNPRAQFTLAVHEAQDVAVAVYDALGRRVARLHQGRFAANRAHRFEIDGSGWASGLYVIRIVGEHFQATQPVILVK